MITHEQIESYVRYLRDHYVLRDYSDDELKKYAKGAIEKQIEAEEKLQKSGKGDLAVVRMVPLRFLK
jgi:hypothetical protein